MPLPQYTPPYVSKDSIKSLVETVLIRTDVVLAGGEKSDYYYDVKKLLLHPVALQRLKDAVFLILWDNGLTTRVKSFGGMETGSIPLVTALCESTEKPGFYVRKQPKPYGLQRQIEGNLISPTILVEDVITTGHSLIKAVDVIQKEQVEILAIISVVDRSKDDLQKLFVKKGIRYFTLYEHKSSSS